MLTIRWRIVRSILTIGGAKSLQFILISVACSNYPPAPSSTNSLSKQFAGTYLYSAGKSHGES